MYETAGWEYDRSRVCFELALDEVCVCLCECVRGAREPKDSVRVRAHRCRAGVCVCLPLDHMCTRARAVRDMSVCQLWLCVRVCVCVCVCVC